MKKKNNHPIFAVLENESKKKTFVDLDKLAKEHCFTMDEIEALAKENSDYDEILKMAIQRILCNAERLALFGKLSLKEYDKIYSRYDPEAYERMRSDLEVYLKNEMTENES